MIRRLRILLLVAWLPLTSAIPASTSEALFKNVTDNAIASAHPLATQAGYEILAAGGNAFDAAVAITAALAVVEPYSSGIGGGGFYLLHRTMDGFETMLDARETAPGRATSNMYLDEDGNVIPGLSRNGPLSAGIPGIPAALEHLAKRYGKLPLNKSLAPAIRYAKQGFR
jgi:gamma-glutamyltranspeptidase/glutathione hydrolase